MNLLLSVLLFQTYFLSLRSDLLKMLITSLAPRKFVISLCFDSSISTHLWGNWKRVLQWKLLVCRVSDTKTSPSQSPQELRWYILHGWMPYGRRNGRMISDNIDNLGLGYYSPFPYLRSSTYLRCFTNLWCLTNLRYFSYLKNFTYLSTFLTVDALLTWGAFLSIACFFTWGALLTWDALLTWGAFLCWAALLELLYFNGVLHLLEVLLLLEVFHLLELFLSGKVFHLRCFTNLSCFTLFCTPLIRS